MKNALVFLLAFPIVARADALTDLRATLTQLAATTPVHGTFEVNSSNVNSDEDHPFAGKATVAFESNETGLRLIYPRALVDQATQEARMEAQDPNRQTPTRDGTNRVHTLTVAERLDAAAALTTELLTAQLVQTKPGMYKGKAARVVTLKLNPKMSKGASKHMKSLDATLTVYLGDDGVPLGADRTVVAKASFLLMTFQSDQKQSWTYARTGDRLVAMRYEESVKSDGFGQHNSSTVTETIRLE